MRYRRLFFALVLTVTLVPAGSTVAQVEPVYTFTGSGWGHGVGMSQYGARAMAAGGWSADQILTTYYSGVSIRPIDQVFDATHWMRTDPRPLWIGLAQNQANFAFSVQGGQAALCKANDGEGACPTQYANPGESWDFRALGGGVCQFFKNGSAVGNPGSCRASIEWTPQMGAVINALGRQYARGVIRIRPVGAAFHVSLQLGLEEYMYGIGEMPSSWPAAALQAQVIAARTYGVRQALKQGAEPSFSSTRQAQCWCHLYAGVVDQNYVGYGKETADLTGSWVAAVDATSGRLITHPLAPESTVIIAYYSSSSGGVTDTNVDGLGATTLLPYLPSIPDEWSRNSAAQNPYASWSKSLTATEIATALGLSTVTGISITARHGSGTVKEVTIGGTINGVATTITRTGRSFRSALGLRSIAFDFTAPDGAVVPIGDGAICSTEAPPAGYTDVPSSSAHYADVNCMALYDIMDPLSPTVFDATAGVRRWQMAVYLTRLAKLGGVVLPAPSDQGFSDLGGLPPEVVDAINQLAALQITNGVAPGVYDPNGVVPRWQMAIFLIRLHEAFGFEALSGADRGFTDLTGYSDVAILSINQLAELGITLGTSATTYSPGMTTTKEQMASFLARIARLDT